MNESIKNLLIDYYSHSQNEAVVPQRLIPKIIEIILKQGINEITQVVFFENAYADNLISKTLTKHAKELKINRFYAVQYLKQLKDKKCEYLLAQDKKAGITSSIFALSKAQSEKLPDFTEFILFDNNFAIINRSIFVCENIFTENKNIILDCIKWVKFVNSQKEIIYANDFLQEPLMQSADMMYEVASLCCSHDHVNNDSCQWYHSIWQYLRLLDMVSTPSWHHDFYINHLFDNVEGNKRVPVLISGTADYSILSYVLHVAKNKEIDADVSVIDLCETPLFACRWYANKLNKKVNAMQTSVFDLDENIKYDMVCADAFLTRFKGEQFKNVVSKWYNVLNPGGIAVTTVRVHDENHACPKEPLETAVQKFKEKAIQRMEVWERHINLTTEEMGEKAEAYARTMVSNYLGTKEHILEEIKNCGFSVDYIEDVEVSGELYPSRYIRLVLKKV